MSDTREKLIEMLDIIIQPGQKTLGDIADHLIANGVRLETETSDKTSDKKTSEWIPVSERLPESGVHVLLCCEIRSGTVYRRYVCDGYYVKRYTEQVWNNSGDIDCEYREEDDEYYLLEGWYEVIKNWDDYSSVVIDDFVTHWMPLPEPPKGE